MQAMKLDDPLFDYALRGFVSGIKDCVTTENVNTTNKKGHSALMIAAYHGHEDVTQFLLNAGSDPNIRDHQGTSVLMAVASKGHLIILKMLIDSGAGKKGALQFAQMYGRKEVANFLNPQKIFSFSDQISSWLLYVFVMGQKALSLK
jgi:hypothetical protein